MKREFLLRLIFFIVLPLVAAEFIFRIVPSAQEYYLSKVNPFYSVTDMTKRHYYFIGSSHVAAAVVSQMFNDHFITKNIETINAGRGSSSSTMFYFALLDLADRNLLDSSIVFVEAPGGISAYSDDSRDEWVNSQNIHLLIPYLDWNRFIKFWKYSSNSIHTKLEVTVNYFFYTSRIWSLFKETYQNNTLAEMVKKTSERFFGTSVNDKKEVNNNNIVNQGGIKTDSISIKAARDLAYIFFKSESENQEIIPHTVWHDSRLSDIHKLLLRHNSELVIYKMPVSSVEAQKYQTKIAQYNIRQFQQYIRQEGIEYLDFDFSTYTDDDFPDLWHLSSKKAIEYTDSIINRLQYQNTFQ